MTREQDKDSEFEAYLQGKSSLSDVYGGLPQAKLPDHLDAAILAEAHRAVGARPGAKPGRSWVIPLSMAASLFVVVIIGMQLRYLLPGEVSPQAPRSEQSGPENQKAELPREADKLVTLNKGMAAPVQAEQKPARAPEGGLLDMAPAMPAPAAPPAPKKEAAAVQEAPQFRVSTSRPMAEQAAPAAEAPAPVVAEKVAQEEQAGKGAARMKAKSASSEADVDAYAPQPAPVEAIAAAPQATPASEPQVAMGAVSMANLRPADWLSRIKQLKQQGKLDEARKELAAFKKRYPDYKLPKELGNL
ncbi:MAG TPA: hypothetical protein VIU46_02735 [Gallionellaceae bacterium]